MNTSHRHAYSELIKFQRRMGSTKLICMKSMNEHSAFTQWTFYQLCVALRTSMYKDDIERTDKILKGLLRFIRNTDNLFGDATWSQGHLTKAQCDAWRELVSIVKYK